MSKKELYERISLLRGQIMKDQFKISNLELEIKHLKYRFEEDIRTTNANLETSRKIFKVLANALGGKIIKSKIVENDKIVEVFTLEKKIISEKAPKIKKAGRPRKLDK